MHIKTIPNAIDYLRHVLNPGPDAGLNNLESLFNSIPVANK